MKMFDGVANVKECEPLNFIAAKNTSSVTRFSSPL